MHAAQNTNKTKQKQKHKNIYTNHVWLVYTLF